MLHPIPWLKQFCAEQLVTVRNRQGFSKLEWQKLRERNEALDCRVYARAAAWIAGIDRWSERTWANLEGQAGMAQVAGPNPQSNDAPRSERARPRRETGWLAGRQRNWLR
jgi:phage terminase large subunit GpA-like protein